MQNFKKERPLSSARSFVKKTLLLLSGLIMFLFIPLISRSQTQTIVNSTLKGQVIDQVTRKGIAGASVSITGTTHSVQTDKDGRFNFVTGQKLPYTLVITFIGYEKREVIARTEAIEIELKEITNQLNDVVVVAYGSQERRNVIGSVVKTSLDDVKNIPGGSFESQLQGKVAGVQITNNTGVPGETVNIRLRGANSINGNNNPLYVIDGVFISNTSLQTYDTGGKSTSPIADINPNDIASISVLKDAEATVLYGVRGANGVVIITTKRGNFNQKPKLDLNVNNGFAKAIKLWDLATGPQHAELINENYINTGGTFATRPFRPVFRRRQRLT